MAIKEKKKSIFSSLKSFLSSPLVKPDSRFVQYSGIGVQLAATILIFLFIGIFIDNKLSTKFVFTLVFTLLGFFGGFYKFYLTIKDLDKKNKNKGDK